MAASYRTNGPTSITIDSVLIGFSSADGVQFFTNQYTAPIFSDERGPSIPAEMLNNGTDGRVVGEFYKFDYAALNTAVAKRNGGTVGSMGSIGDLMFANSRTSVIILASPVDGKVITINRGWFDGEVEYDLSTQWTRVPFTLVYVPDSSGICFTTT